MSQPKQIKYDYIIAGMGASGLSLAMRLAKSAVEFSRILIIDKAQKNKNDRTWCFWTKETNDWYAPLIKNSWQNISFNSTTYHNKFNIAPYTYVLIIIACHFYKKILVSNLLQTISSALQHLIIGLN